MDNYELIKEAVDKIALSPELKARAFNKAVDVIKSKPASGIFMKNMEKLRSFRKITPKDVKELSHKDQAHAISRIIKVKKRWP